MTQQNTQGFQERDSLAGAVGGNTHESAIRLIGIEEGGENDLLSSPRQSELSLISDSTNQQNGESRAIVQDPNFSQLPSGLNSPDIIPQVPPEKHLQQLYQTQQQQMSFGDPSRALGQTLAPHSDMNSLLHRQSLPQGPITDRKRQQRDSMDGSRQGMQGASGLGNAFLIKNFNHPSATKTSQTNDRLSSVQFVLSQSDRSQTLPPQFAALPEEQQRQLLTMQWSLTQEDSSSELSKQQVQVAVAQNYTSLDSFDPNIIQSEDYQSQLTAVNVPNITENRPIVIKAIQAMEQYRQQLAQPQPLQPPQPTSQQTSSSDQADYLSGSRPLPQRLFQDCKVSSPEKVMAKSPDTSSNRNPSTLKVKQRTSSIAMDKDLELDLIMENAPEPQDFTAHHRQHQHHHQRHHQHQHSLQSHQPEQQDPLAVQEKQQSEPQVPVAYALGRPPRCSSQKSLLEELRSDDMSSSANDEEGGDEMIATISLKDTGTQQSERLNQVIHEGELKLSQGSASFMRVEQNCLSPMGPSPTAIMGRQARLPVEAVQLPLPDELFKDGGRLSSEFDEPLKSAENRQLPSEIFTNQCPKETLLKTEEKAQTSTEKEMRLQALGERAKHSLLNELPPIDYSNLPISVSNALLKRAISSDHHNPPGSTSKDHSTFNLLATVNSAATSQEGANDKSMKMSDLHNKEIRPVVSPPINIDEAIQNLEKEEIACRSEQDSKEPLNLTDQNTIHHNIDLTIAKLAMTTSSDSNESQGIICRQDLECTREVEGEIAGEVEAEAPPEPQPLPKQGKAPEESQVISCLISGRSSDKESDASPSLMFSQTNNDRMTLQSVMYTHEKNYAAQSFQKSQNFPQTDSKPANKADDLLATRGGSNILINHQHAPSALFAVSQTNHSQQANSFDMFPGQHQQSCSSFANDNSSRKSFFVNALGQRISSDVLTTQMHPSEQQFHEFQRQRFEQIHSVVQEVGETMSTIPDEAHAAMQEREIQGRPSQPKAECEEIQVAVVEPSAPKYPSTTKQSVTEVNFNSVEELANQQQNFTSINQGKRNILGNASRRQLTLMNDNLRENESAADSVKRNLNLHEAFQTHNPPAGGNIDTDRHDCEQSQTDSVYLPPSDCQSTNRIKHRAQLPQSYTLEAHSQFYQRYHKSWKRQSKHSSTYAGEDLTFQNEGELQSCIVNEDEECVSEGGYAGEPASRSTPESVQENTDDYYGCEDDSGEPCDDTDQIQLVMLQARQDLTERLITSERHMYLCSEDQMTDEDIAVFRSQINDIPQDLGIEPSRRMLQFNQKHIERANLPSTFDLELEEQDPRSRLIHNRSTSKNSHSRKKSRAYSLSTYQGTDEDQPGGGVLEDRLSPKFEKLMFLQSLPSHQEHMRKPQPQRAHLMLNTIDVTEEGMVTSPPLTTNPTTKSFLQKMVARQKMDLNTIAHEIVTPSSKPKQSQQIMYPEQSLSPGQLSEDECNLLGMHRSAPGQQQVVVPHSTTNAEMQKKMQSLIATMNNIQKNQTRTLSVRSSSNRSFHDHANTSAKKRTAKKKKIITGKKQGQPGLPRTQTLPVSLSRQGTVPRDLSEWLSSLGLTQYGPLLVEQGLDDLESLISMMATDRVLPLTHDILIEAGIMMPGHRSRLLVNLELASGAFETNQEVLQLLEQSKMSNEEVVRQAEQLCHSNAVTARKTPDLDQAIAVSPTSAGNMTEKPFTCRSPLRPPAYPPSSSHGAKHQQLTQLSLSSWLQRHNLLQLQPLFVRSGYECLRSLILQSFSQFNKLTDDTLVNEIGVEKIGHRLRILSQLRQDALVLFQMEVLARTKQEQPVEEASSLFVLPNSQHNRSQKHFKSVFSSGGGSQPPQQHTQSQQYLLPVTSGHHHKSQQQPASKKLRKRNYSFSSKGGNGVHDLGTNSSLSIQEPPLSNASSSSTSFQQYKINSSMSRQPRVGLSSNAFAPQPGGHHANNGSFIRDQVESNLNPWRHSTYFDASKPVANEGAGATTQLPHALTIDYQQDLGQTRRAQFGLMRHPKRGVLAPGQYGPTEQSCSIF